MGKLNKTPIKGGLPDEVQPVVKARVNRTKKTETPRTQQGSRKMK